jgi:hypothetical protein
MAAFFMNMALVRAIGMTPWKAAPSLHLISLAFIRLRFLDMVMPLHKLATGTFSINTFPPGNF